MILRVTFFALMALGLLGLGFIGYTATRPPPETEAEAAAKPPPPVLVRVLVAAHDIAGGALLKPADLASKEIPSPAPVDAAPDNEDERHGLVGAMLRRGLSAGDVIHETDALRSGDHGFLAAVLKGDMRAVTVGVDATSGTAGLIWPGDRVDLILTQTIADPSLPVGRRIVAETVVSNARVIAIDQRMVQGAANSGPAPDARTVTLEVNKNDAQGVQVAIHLGRLSLSVRPADSQTNPDTKPARTVTTWASDVSPALAGDVPPPTNDRVIKVWQSTGDGKDFKF